MIRRIAYTTAATRPIDAIAYAHHHNARAKRRFIDSISLPRIHGAIAPTASCGGHKGVELPDVEMKSVIIATNIGARGDMSSLGCAASDVAMSREGR